MAKTRAEKAAVSQREQEGGKGEKPKKSPEPQFKLLKKYLMKIARLGCFGSENALSRRWKLSPGMD